MCLVGCTDTPAMWQVGDSPAFFLSSEYRHILMVCTAAHLSIHEFPHDPTRRNSSPTSPLRTLLVSFWSCRLLTVSCEIILKMSFGMIWVISLHSLTNPSFILCQSHVITVVHLCMHPLLETNISITSMTYRPMVICLFFGVKKLDIYQTLLTVRVCVRVFVWIYPM